MAAFSSKRTYFLISANYFKNCKFLVPLSSTSGGDRGIRPLNFWWKFIQFLFEAIFNTIDNFGSLQPPKKHTFSFQYMANVWRPLAPLLGETKICFHWVFRRKFNSAQLLFEAVFDIINNFCNIQPYCLKNNWNVTISTLL